MPEKTQLEKASELSVQAWGRGEVESLPAVLPWLTIVGQLISPWWSQQRDKELRVFWKKVDHLSGTIYTFQSRISTIPFHVEARDMSISSHVRQADLFTEMLLDDSQFGSGWNAMIEPAVEDLIGVDNGMVLEVIGDGKPDGPIEGPVMMVNHLDSNQCRRTSNPEFPIIYMDPNDGKLYKLHRSRVIYQAQLPSASTKMNGVGVCAVSRCINIAQNIYDILVYKQEKLGSRPPRSVWITKGKLTPDIVSSAFVQAASMMDNQRLTRYSKIVLIGSGDAPDASIEDHDVASLPDGFDEQTSITLGMATISLAFGVDARELFPGLSAGATRAEALVQHLKQRGKGYGQTIQMLERQFNNKVLPPHLKIVFDYQDDAEDMQVAEIRSKRAETRVRNMVESGVTDRRTERENMLRDGDITQAQFERLELDDGRLEDGSDVLTLFSHKDFREALDLGVENPLDISANDNSEMLRLIDERRAVLFKLRGEQTNVRIKKEIDQALAALEELQDQYEGAKPTPKPAAPPTSGTEPSEITPTAEPEAGLVVESEDMTIDETKALIPIMELKTDDTVMNMDAFDLYYFNMLRNRTKQKESEQAQAIREVITVMRDIASQPVEINIEVPETKPPIINVEPPIVNVEAPIVKVEPQTIPAPVVHVDGSKDTNNILAAFKSLTGEIKSLVKELGKDHKPPKVEVTVNPEISMPAHEEVTEKVVERDGLNRIYKTVSTKKIVKK